MTRRSGGNGSGSGGKAPHPAAGVAAAAAAACLLPFAAGCDNPTPRNEGGPEMSYLTSRPPSLPAAALGPRALLPLAPGAAWDMDGESPGRGGGGRFEARVAGAAPAGAGGAGTLVEVRRDGRMWRREVYRSGPKTLSLQASAEEERPFMVFSPAVPLVRYPLSEGQSSKWSGSFRFGGRSFPATAFSRVSAIEPVATGQGTLRAYRVDTMILVSMGGEPVKFPTVRWLAPGVGFVRRGFMDGGKGVYTRLRRFQPAGGAAAAASPAAPKPPGR